MSIVKTETGKLICNHFECPYMRCDYHEMREEDIFYISKSTEHLYAFHPTSIDEAEHCSRHLDI